ncbi:phosphate acetyltransferase [Lactobacillus helsingborgensis]|uniref:phosphate acetyltransferase n=1 Tax=Lactobacillus helsingborgensis TaxID=1218494 RepID=UPI002263BEFF|nr:phosphate acetyltransferase [Lactobacillus helsingborgensis]UZX32118.1 phosphate acetyltransferase [Lactobacillus helsingborgensis]
MSVFDLLKNKVQNSNKTYQIVFPEGNDLRVLKAASKLSLADIVKPILLGEPEEIKALITKENLEFSQLEIIDPLHYEKQKSMVQKFIDARRKDIAKSEAEKALKDPNYFGTMLVKIGQADGMVSGATHSTAATVRPALQLIHTAAGMNRVSGSFIMERAKEKYIFADCAINIDPDSETLAEIAYQSVQTARMIDIDPKVAFLSFSTNGSAKGEMVTKVKEAATIFHQQHPEIVSDGELQFDAAFVPDVAASKAPASALKGQANIFIFPELQSGNISYKITQRLANFTAIGPILQGLQKPVNDLSRGANTQDIYHIAILTAAQALLRDEQNEG